MAEHYYQTYHGSNARKTVLVVTPTMDGPFLQEAIQSVQQQETQYTFDHLLVYDGVQPKVTRGILPPNIKKMVLPWNTGKNGFYGHRIYASISHLVDHDVILFLDEDNTYTKNHIESLVNYFALDATCSFTYSMRNIMDEDGKFICVDRFESIGEAGASRLVDTSSYAFDRKFLIRAGHIWNHGWGADRRFFQYVYAHEKYYQTQTPTLNYRLGGNPGSPNRLFFLQGNEQAGWTPDGLHRNKEIS